MTYRAVLAFYSRTGSTKSLAEEVARLLEESGVEVSLKQLRPARDMGLLEMGRRTITHAPEPVLDCQVDLEDANLLLIGTPVWVSNPAPFVRGFLEGARDLKGLPVVLFATCSKADGQAASELRDMVRCCGGRPFAYEVWRINKDGVDGMERAAERIAQAAVGMLPDMDGK